jgi:hypothetical protein
MPRGQFFQQNWQERQRQALTLRVLASLNRATCQYPYSIIQSRQFLSEDSGYPDSGWSTLDLQSFYSITEGGVPVKV